MPAERWAWLTLAVLALAAATPAEAASRDYDTGEFERIYVRGNAVVQLEQQTGAHTTRAEGSPQRLADLSLESSDGVLYIDAGDAEAAHSLLIRVPVDELASSDAASEAGPHRHG